jgi:hypothetical protein
MIVVLYPSPSNRIEPSSRIEEFGDASHPNNEGMTTVANTENIQKRLDGISGVMVAKGLREPHAQFNLKSHMQPDAHLRWKPAKDRGSYSSDKYEWIKGDSIEALLSNAEAFVAALPDRDQVRFNEFMTALGGVIDLGKENGIEVEFLNPLVATMKRLSENALTHQPA